MALRTNLLHYFRFSNVNDNFGSATGTNHDATLISAKNGNGYSYDGTNDYFDTGFAMPMADDQAYTVAFWLNIDSTLPDNKSMFGRSNLAIGGGSFYHMQHTIVNNQLFLMYCGGSGEKAYVNNVSHDEYIFVVSRVQKSPFKNELWVNNVKGTDGTYDAFNSGADADNIYLGAFNNNGSPHTNYAKCKIDELMVWDRHLSTDEMTAIYNAGVGHFLPFNKINESYLQKRNGVSIKDINKFNSVAW